MVMGAVEGAMSGLSIVVCGFLTVLGSILFAMFI
jgi:putative effector of murein hydrolase